MEENKMEVMTTPPVEPEDKENELDRLLKHMSTNHKSFVVRDRTGLRISFAGLLPITTGENGEQRIWGGSVILNGGELEFPQVDYKVKVGVKRKLNPKLTCNRSKGIIKQSEIFVLTYQLPESSIEAVKLTLLIDGSPHEVPLCKAPKADYYWLGKDTKVPGPKDLIKERQQVSSPKTDPTFKNLSPGRIEEIPEGLKEFLLNGKGLESTCKLLYPHCISLFRDLSNMKLEKFDIKEHLGNGNATDDRRDFLYLFDTNRDPWSGTRGNQGRRNENLDEDLDIPTCTGNIKYDLKLCRYTDLIHHLKTFYENIITTEVTSIEELLTEKLVNGLGRVARYNMNGLCCCTPCKPRYRRLVDSIYPRAVTDGLLHSNMQKLTFYAISHPEKLERIGEYLVMRMVRDLSRQRPVQVKRQENLKPILALESKLKAAQASFGGQLHETMEKWLSCSSKHDASITRFMEATDSFNQKKQFDEFVKLLTRKTERIESLIKGVQR
ncbi:hypothetical protein CAEBREN_30642 [Caenorhabditis brenneri]|uniref:Uncharacterized protein n=1 Tax=Caenorhabditis brenneri TaxID=135651 RepID=G0PE62_CAEBE|nr:hypothetical protein CAEBREN_30642 [Caenorhabditis brenneri]